MKTWQWVVVVAASILVLGLVALAGTGAYFIVHHVDVEHTASPESAAEAFEDVRRRFQGQRPLVEIENGRPSLHDETTPGPTPAESLHLLVWKPDEARLVRLHLPFWLLRLAREGSIELASEDFSSDLAVDLDRIDLTVDDLERHGPGLILDHEEADGDRVLIWAQ
jgi:hypothetical protein